MRAAGFEPTNKKQLLLDEKYIMRYILLSKKSNNTYTIVKSDITVKIGQKNYCRWILIVNMTIIQGVLGINQFNQDFIIFAISYLREKWLDLNYLCAADRP